MSEDPGRAVGALIDVVDSEIRAGTGVFGGPLEGRPSPIAEHQCRQPGSESPATAETGQSQQRHEDAADHRIRPAETEIAAFRRVGDGEGQSGDEEEQDPGEPFGPRDQGILGHENCSGQDQKRMFVRPVEQQGGHDRAEQAAEHATERHRQVKTGQMADRRAKPEKLAVKRNGDGQQKQQAQSGGEERIAAAIAEGEAAGDQDDQWGDHRHQSRRTTARGEGNHEAQKIEAERQGPEERHGDDVGGEMGRRRQHQAGRNRRQRDPVKSLAKRRCRTRFVRHDFDSVGGNGEGADDDQEHQQPVNGRPQNALLLQRQ